MQTRNLTITLLLLIVLAACGQTEAAPTAVPPTEAPSLPQTYTAQVSNYNLGDATLLQEQFPEDNRFRHMPVRLEGVIAAPETDEARPVVLILHGSHDACDEDVWPCPEDVEQKNYEGFTYLVKALAEAGYVALSINVNAEHTFAYGETPPPIRTAQLIDLHLAELAAANAGESDKFGLDLNGRVDLSRMVWMGHSRGADLVNWIIRDQKLDQTASPAGYGPVQGQLFLAPALSLLGTLPTVDLPTALILPSCDADIRDLGGQGFYESARFDADRANPLTSVYLEHGNHNNFNTILPPDFIAEDWPEYRAECVREAVLAAADQQDFLVQYTLDFLRMVYDGSDAAASVIGVNPAEPAPADLYGFSVQIDTLYPAADRLTVMQPQSEAELSQNLLGGETTMTGVTAVYCPEDRYTPEHEPGTEPCKRVNLNQPGYPQELVLSWEEMGAEWRMAVPEANRDLAGYTALQLRAVPDPLSQLNAAGEPQSFTVELVDGDGNRAQLATESIPFPVGEEVENNYFEGGRFSGHVVLRALRLPLAEFTAVDLTNITEIALIFDQTPSGALFIADLELLKSESE